MRECDYRKEPNSESNQTKINLQGRSDHTQECLGGDDSNNQKTAAIRASLSGQRVWWYAEDEEIPPFGSCCRAERTRVGRSLRVAPGYLLIVEREKSSGNISLSVKKKKKKSQLMRSDNYIPKKKKKKKPLPCFMRKLPDAQW